MSSGVALTGLATVGADRGAEPERVVAQVLQAVVVDDLRRVAVARVAATAVRRDAHRAVADRLGQPHLVVGRRVGVAGGADRGGGVADPVVVLAGGAPEDLRAGVLEALLQRAARGHRGRAAPADQALRRHRDRAGLRRWTGCPRGPRPRTAPGRCRARAGRRPAGRSSRSPPDRPAWSQPRWCGPPCRCGSRSRAAAGAAARARCPRRRRCRGSRRRPAGRAPTTRAPRSPPGRCGRRPRHGWPGPAGHRPRWTTWTANVPSATTCPSVRRPVQVAVCWPASWRPSALR